MAKAKNTASEGTPKVSADILRKLDELSVGISKVRGTARCVQLALFHQLSHGDREISIMVREHIVHELHRLKKQTDSIMIALAGRLPFSEKEELDDMVE
jgi:hypothetical protein